MFRRVDDVNVECCITAYQRFRFWKAIWTNLAAQSILPSLKDAIRTGLLYISTEQSPEAMQIKNQDMEELFEHRTKALNLVRDITFKQHQKYNKELQFFYNKKFDADFHLTKRRLNIPSILCLPQEDAPIIKEAN